MVAPELPVVNLVVLVSSLLRHLCIHPIRVSAPSSTRAGRTPRAIVRVRTREREREREREKSASRGQASERCNVLLHIEGIWRQG